MEHTPGPWNIQATDENDLAWEISYDTEDGLTYPIADIISYPEATANAKLIAAAPEMLEACKKAHEFIKTTWPSDLELILRLAIAKAE